MHTFPDSDRLSLVLLGLLLCVPEARASSAASTFVSVHPLPLAGPGVVVQAALDRNELTIWEPSRLPAIVVLSLEGVGSCETLSLYIDRAGLEDPRLPPGFFSNGRIEISVHGPDGEMLGREVFPAEKVVLPLRDEGAQLSLPRDVSLASMRLTLLPAPSGRSILPRIAEISIECRNAGVDEAVQAENLRRIQASTRDPDTPIEVHNQQLHADGEAVKAVSPQLLDQRSRTLGRLLREGEPLPTLPLRELRLGMDRPQDSGFKGTSWYWLFWPLSAPGTTAPGVHGRPVAPRHRWLSVLRGSWGVDGQLEHIAYTDREQEEGYGMAGIMSHEAVRSCLLTLENGLPVEVYIEHYSAGQGHEGFDMNQEITLLRLRWSADSKLLSVERHSRGRSTWGAEPAADPWVASWKTFEDPPVLLVPVAAPGPSATSSPTH